MSNRRVEKIIQGTDTSDGAGVKLRRVLGANRALRVDPFLMLDEFGSDEPQDYLGGFPPHPHRGFETVTYMLDGHMRHEDHLGNVGELKSGGVQWMTAGRGIIHSEMPQQEQGRMRGFQLWVNLPARDKMQPAGYRDIPPKDIPVVALANGGAIKLIAGSLELEGERVAGPINGEPGSKATDPFIADVTLPGEATTELPVTPGHSAFVYAFEGELAIENENVARHAAAVLGDGERVVVTAGAAGARFLLVAGKPIGEPVVQHGPFVMNTREEIEQAIADFKSGRLAA